MGRRKIEIEPITHERNRSVTFLKRKNGLFKKAYELGVLCSVDVAVIIFEERPGHHVKLYQYCSGNVEEIVQRHAKFDGDRDTRNPDDFTNGSDSKLDDVLEGDDDEDEPEPIPTRGPVGTKKSGDAKAKVDVGVKAKQSASKGAVPPPDMDPLAHRPMTIPNPPMPMSAGSFSIPISGEMQSSNGSSSKARLGHPMGLGHPLQEDMSPGYGYHPSSAPPAYRGPHYPPYFPVSSSPPPFLPGSPYDYHPRSHYRPMTYPPTRSIPPYHQHPDPYMRLTAQQYHHHQQQHGYPPMMYPPPPPPPQQSQHPGDIFVGFLDGDPRQHGGPAFGPMDWPAHAPIQDGRPDQGDPNDTSWLDFLSNNPPLTNVSMQVSPSQLAGGSEMISRERHHSLGNGTMATSSGPTSSNASALTSPKRKSSKRPRIDSGVDKGLDGDVTGDVEMITPASARNGTKITTDTKVNLEKVGGGKCDEE